MSLLTIIETILLGPLKLIFEIIFSIAYRVTRHPGIAIIVLSLIMNILVLPLYRRADAMQEQARDKEAKLRKGINHIKKNFSGDERMMILQTYYRQNHYSPFSSLSGSVSLLLEIPFFMAAYQFLSDMSLLIGVSFGPIVDLSAPDRLFVLSNGFVINVLPILMTLINVLTSAIYLKGFPLKSKMQLYGMAGIFLVLLYNSPSGLVFYWTLNNVFSLVKTIFYKLKNPQKVLGILCSVAGAGILFYDFFLYHVDFPRMKIFMALVGVLLQLPMILYVVSKKVNWTPKHMPAPNRKVFIWCSLFLTVLIGLMIPTTFVAASPQEFVNIAHFYHPMWYIVRTLCMSVGVFLVWVQVFYWLANDMGKVIFEKLIWLLCGVMLVNYMFFGTKLGVLSSALQYENGLLFSAAEQVINILVLLLVCVVMYFIMWKWKKKLGMVLLVAIISMFGMSAVKMVTIVSSIAELSAYESTEGMPQFKLSKTGQNVIVIMFDRAMGGYVPYLFNEKPELYEQFAGFTYYSNTISHGPHTVMGAPGLLGGYEYTPVEMNKRDEESLVSKNNEANKVMPVLFLENDFEVTVCDPILTNYQWIPDLSVYDDYPEINTYNLNQSFEDLDSIEGTIDSTGRNFFCFSLMKTLPLCLQPTLYNNGIYNQIITNDDEIIGTSQNALDISTAIGGNANLNAEYRILQNLPNMSQISDEDENTFLFMSNDITHEIALLQTPEYTPSNNINNTSYDLAHADRFTVDGKTLVVETDTQMAHYHANMAAMLQLGNWFDYMRENGVYDNTRIILVSDHGRSLYQQEELNYLGDLTDSYKELSLYYPLLMVKDFGATEFTTSDEFMTNADVPTLAVQDIIENPINPFTGKEINNAEKTAHEQLIIMSGDMNPAYNWGNEFQPSRWASVKDDLWNRDSWSFYDELVVLKEHELPQE